MKRLGMILIILVVIAIICFQVFDLRTIIMKRMYPKEYTGFVEEYSKQNGIDPLLIFAIIKAESNFNANAKSKSGAKGLMQLMDNTAMEIANEIELKDLQPNDLYDARMNIQIGTYYFAVLLTKYEQNIGLALAAYNAGLRTSRELDRKWNNWCRWRRLRKHSL